MNISGKGFYNKYREYILFNKNLIIAGITATIASAFVAQLYASHDSNSILNSFIALVAEYGVYIPIFAILFYWDNKKKYVDSSTGKRDSAKLRSDFKKLVAAFSISEIFYIVTRTSLHYLLLQLGLEPYQASVTGSVVGGIVFIVCINTSVKHVKLFRKT